MRGGAFFGKHLALRQDEMEKLVLLAVPRCGLVAHPAEVTRRDPLTPGSGRMRGTPKGHRGTSPPGSVAEEILCHQEKATAQRLRGSPARTFPFPGHPPALRLQAMTGWRSYRPSLSSEEASRRPYRPANSSTPAWRGSSYPQDPGGRHSLRNLHFSGPPRAFQQRRPDPAPPGADLLATPVLAGTVGKTLKGHSSTFRSDLLPYPRWPR